MAARFWVGGSGNFNDTNHWATTSGGSNNPQSVPSTGDTATVDGHASGLNGGTLTINQNVTVQSFTWGAAIGTIDNSGNFNFTMTGASPAWFTGSGSGARTFLGGTGTYTSSGNFAGNAGFSIAVATSFANPTTAFASATIVLAGTGTIGGILSGSATSVTYGTVTFTGHASIGGYAITGTHTIGTLNVTAPNALILPNGVTTSITNAFSWTGTQANRILVTSNSPISVATIAVGSGTATLDWGVLRGITTSGGTARNATNTLDLGSNTWSSITGPPAGGGSVIIGG